LAVTSKNFQLVAESHHLKPQIGTSSKTRANAMKGRNQDFAHAPTLWDIELKSQNFCVGRILWEGQHSGQCFERRVRQFNPIRPIYGKVREITYDYLDLCGPTKEHPP
jgi:hypothetical protein